MIDPHLPHERLAAVAHGGEPSDDEAEHLLECASCRSRVDQAAGVAEIALLLEQTPTPPLPPPEAILAQVARRAPRRRWPRVVVALGAAAALAAAWALWPRAPQPPQVDVQATAGSLVREVAGSNGEAVVLEGEATFRVQPLAAGRRYRVRVRDDEVEVKGTTFTLRASPEGLALAEVTEGVVEVRTVCCGAHTLAAGQHWERPATAAAAPSGQPAPTPQATASAAARPGASGASLPASSPASSLAGGPAGEGADDLRRRGLASFDAGQYGQAAAALDKAIALEPQAPWARDARTLSGAARVLQASPAAIPGMGVGTAAFDKAAQQAARTGDGARASAARLGAARQSQGKARETRYCALKGEAGLGADAQAEIARECR